MNCCMVGTSSCATRKLSQPRSAKQRFHQITPSWAL
jgi:hypothetical protein